MDARVRYTNLVIKNSFVQLLQEKPLNKITVKRICELSEINRATFYKYYADPYDLFNQMETELIIELKALIDESDSKELTETLIVILNKMKENCVVYTSLFSNHGNSSFMNQILILCYHKKRNRMNDTLPGLTLRQQEWFYYYIAQGSCAILNCWVKNGMMEDPEDVAKFLSRLNQLLSTEFMDHHLDRIETLPSNKWV